MSGLKTATLPADTHPAVQAVVSEITAQAQAQQHTQYTVAPLAGQVPEGGWVFAKISGTVYGYTKINGALYRVALTAV